MQNLVIHPQNSEAFELEAVSRVLIELRLRKSQERHREHLHRQITHAAKIPDTMQGELEKLLPPRRQWKRPAHRGASTHRMKKRALEAAVLPKLCGDGEGLKESGWGKRLLAFAAEVQERYRHPERGLSAPERMDIPKTDGKTRTLSLYTDLHERVLLRLLFLELRRVLDPSLSEHVLAFRANRPDGRHDAVRILGKRAADPAPCFAGELDICAFFDEIDHSAVLRSLEEAALDLGCVLDPLAVAWVKAYLDSTKKKKGIPQGGSLSPLLCNLVLRNADQAVREACPHPGTLYFRYCDDMILITNAEADCARGLDAFLLALENLQLRSHAFTRADSLHEKEFLCQKSKRPYLWSTKKEEPNACAWVSYMGYEIHRGGGMRVRGKV